MRPRRKRRDSESWEQMRRRLVAETSAWLTDALEHPEHVVHIPTIPAGSGTFPPSLARAFWKPVLTS